MEMLLAGLICVVVKVFVVFMQKNVGHSTIEK